MQLTSIAALLALVTSASALINELKPAFLVKDVSQLQKYGNSKCPCIGIDNLKGDFPVPFEVYNAKVNYPVEVGSSCEAWEKNTAPDCQKADAPDWCKQKWCYVDPCNCDLEVLPKQTSMGLTYQGSTAYWSYKTCGGVDLWSTGLKDACVNQKNEKDCSSLSKCAWDGKQCGGKEVVQTCKAAKMLDETIHGQEDCRCIGIGGKNGISKMYINDTHEVGYPADVGSRCLPWEGAVHPDCQKPYESYAPSNPAWCYAKWCWVDPCKCKTKAQPMAVMAANSALKFQGMVAHWSYEACGSVNSWAAANKEKYCSTQKSSSDCSKLGKCAWTGTECLTKEVAKLCDAKAQESLAHRIGLSSMFLVLVFRALA